MDDIIRDILRVISNSRTRAAIARYSKTTYPLQIQTNRVVNQRKQTDATEPEEERKNAKCP
jgi:hypothetical protein